MKTYLLKSLSIFMAIVLFVAQSQSLAAKSIEISLPEVDESVFTLDETELNAAMKELNELEKYLALNEGTSYNDLLIAGSDLIANFSDTSSPMGMMQEGEAPLGIPAFLWGCFLGWVGILLLYIVTDNDKEQVKKALKGCLVAGGLYIVIGVVYVVLVATYVSSVEYY